MRNSDFGMDEMEFLQLESKGQTQRETAASAEKSRELRDDTATELIAHKKEL